jgi:hypothetical protein
LGWGNGSNGVHEHSAHTNSFGLYNDDDLEPIVGKKGLDMQKLLDRYDAVTNQHKEAKIKQEKNRFSEQIIASETANVSSPKSAPDNSQQNSFHSQALILNASRSPKKQTSTFSNVSSVSESQTSASTRTPINHSWKE